jgi:hypothetical protein
VWQAVGNYGVRALITALDKVFNGSKSTVDYIDEPILTEKEEVIELTEEEFEALPPKEQEKIIMRMFGEAMEDTVSGFNKKKAEGEING